MAEALLEKKIDGLKSILQKMESFAIAFSGGVDSTFLLAIASKLPDIDIIALTASSPMIPTREIKEAKEMAAKFKIKHKIIKTDPLNNPSLKNNPPERCYICKKDLFAIFLDLVKENDLKYLADGTNCDDLKAYRPGLRALKELGVKSPLAEAGLTKEEIRKYSKIMGLPTWDAPALSCLATRIPYNEEITVSKLKMIDKAEQFLRSLRFKQVRVRYYDSLAKIELYPGDINQLLEQSLRVKIINKLKSVGFNHIAIDLEGYQSGCTDEQKN